MADYSNAKINVTLFQQNETERTSDRSPHARGSLEIAVEDLNEFFSVAMALEPVDNWQGKKVIKLKCAAWNKTTRAGVPFQSMAINPDRAAEFKSDEPFTTGACEVKPPLVATTVVADDEEI